MLGYVSVVGQQPTSQSPCSLYQQTLQQRPRKLQQHPEDGIADVTQLEDDICQLLADALHLHERVENGVLVVKIQQKRFSFAQLTFDRKPQVKYELAS
jgi:phosphoglycerate-specific signal transduction histidine kinase